MEIDELTRSYEAAFKKAINKTNAAAWHHFFIYPAILKKADIIEAAAIAVQLEADCQALCSTMMGKRPRSTDFRELSEWIRQEWARVIPEKVSCHTGLLEYIYGTVIPKFQNDCEAVEKAQDIGRAVDNARETVIEALSIYPSNIVFIDTPKTTVQLKKIYNALALKRYIARDTWPDFYRCFDALALFQGRIYWKKEGKNHKLNKRAICDFLALFDIDKAEWAKYVCKIFNEEISPAAITNATAGHSVCYNELKAIICKDE